MKSLFPVNHNEKFLYLQDVEEKDGLKSELDCLEGLLACRAVSVTRMDWKNPAFLCKMPLDFCFLFG